MRTGKDRVRLKAVQVPATIDGVVIQPGDVVCCDEDGVVAVPADRAADVATVAERIEAVEARIVEAVRAGATLAEARAAQGYHALQTPTSEGASA
jgi:regulator of RNase E activity RraA